MAFVRYDETGNQIRNRTVLDCQKAVENGEEIRVEQSHKTEVDINKIVRKHGNDIVASVANMQNWRFDDVTGNDFQEVMNKMIHAKEQFEKIPSEIRDKFGNDAAAFMDFVYQPENHDQMVKWGLAEEGSKPPDPIKVIMVNPDTGQPDMVPGSETPPAETV